MIPPQTATLGLGLPVVLQAFSHLLHTTMISQTVSTTTSVRGEGNRFPDRTASNERTAIATARKATISVNRIPFTSSGRPLFRRQRLRPPLTE